MWSCPYCGNHSGVAFKDMNLQGMLCMQPDCGRFDQMDEDRSGEEGQEEIGIGSLA
jgi:hypothetical protein